MKRVMTIVVLMIFAVVVAAQKRWKGGDVGIWDAALNWEPNGVPSAEDDILLDNSVWPSTYVVTLPLSAVTVNKLIITPAPGKSISVILPKENVTSPALILHDAGDALVIDSGAVFINSSGLTSGSSISCQGKIRINNGGRYIHNSRSIHANDIVARLSAVPGTEEGIFEFDAPTASTTVSLSNRIFGKLKFSSSANGGVASYNGSGVNPLVIRSDLELSEGVNFSISFSNTVSVKRHLVQRGGTFNIANAAANTILAVGGDVMQTGGTITKTGAGLPVITFNGTAAQQLHFGGSVTGNIIFRIDNPTVVSLATPLSIAYRLELLRGKLRTGLTKMLTLLPASTLLADSTAQSFIEGPVRKEGLSGHTHFLFPVGNNTHLRWLALKNVTGNFTVEYESQNPQSLSSDLSEGLHHISSVERWSIIADAVPAPAAKIELSFDNVNSGGVSDLSALRVSHFTEDEYWTDEGNTAVTGTAGTAGSVASKEVTKFQNNQRYFTLGSSVSGQNTLPLKEISFSVKRRGASLIFNFSLTPDIHPSYFILEGSDNFSVFNELRRFTATPLDGHYLYLFEPAPSSRYFRLIVVETDGNMVYSPVIFNAPPLVPKITLLTSATSAMATVAIQSAFNEQLELQVSDMNGRLLFKDTYRIAKGETRLSFNISNLPKGLYVLNVVYKDHVEHIRFTKQ